MLPGAFRVGMARVIDEDEEIEMACESAKSADAVVLVCGLNLGELFSSFVVFNFAVMLLRLHLKSGRQREWTGKT